MTSYDSSFHELTINSLQESSNSPVKQRKPVKDSEPSIFSKEQQSAEKYPNQAQAYGDDDDSFEEKQNVDPFAMVGRLQVQNHSLKKKVKELNTKLSSARSSDYSQVKGKSDSLQRTLEVEVLRKQLQNTNKQMEHLKRQLQMYTDNPEARDTYEKNKNLEDQLMEREIYIEKLMNEKKMFEKHYKDLEKELDFYRNSEAYDKKLRSLNDENKCLRDKISNMNAVNRHNEASFKKQQAHFVGITQRYRMLCDKLGISPTVLFNRVEELDQLLARKGSKSHRNNENADYEEASSSQTPRQSLLKRDSKPARASSIPVLSDTKSINNRASRDKTSVGRSSATLEDRNSREQIDMQKKIQLLELEKKQMQIRLREKEKEKKTTIVMADDPLDNSPRKRMIKHRSLLRVNKVENSELQFQSQSQINYQNITHLITTRSMNKIDAEPNHIERRAPSVLSSNILTSSKIEKSPIKSSQSLERSSSKQSNPEKKAPLLIPPKPLSNRKEEKSFSNTESFQSTSILDVKQNKVEQKVSSNLLAYPSPSKQTEQTPTLTREPSYQVYTDEDTRKVTGGSKGFHLRHFDDSKKATEVNSEISKLTIWSDDDFIYGIQAFYRKENSVSTAGQEHIKPQLKQKAKFVTSMEIQPGDKICRFLGKYREGLIHLKIETVKGVVYEFNNNKDSLNDFDIAIDPQETAVFLHGAFYLEQDVNKASGSEKEILASIGFTLVRR